jgi:hypothetical protein
VQIRWPFPLLRLCCTSFAMRMQTAVLLSSHTWREQRPSTPSSLLSSGFSAVPQAKPTKMLCTAQFAAWSSSQITAVRELQHAWFERQY